MIRVGGFFHPYQQVHKVFTVIGLSFNSCPKSTEALTFDFAVSAVHLEIYS